MLSKEFERKIRIFGICERSGDILPGTVFRAAELAERDPAFRLPPAASVVCCGAVSESELLFRTGDGGLYFSLRDGWGGEDGVLYGIRVGFHYDFGHPAAEEEIIAECAQPLRGMRSFGGTMVQHALTEYRKAIRTVLERNRRG